MAKRIKPTTADTLRLDMQEAGIYEKRFEHQISDTADTIDSISAMQKQVKKDGMVIDEMKDKGIGFKKVAHPLISQISALKKVLTLELASLGLNKQSEKKTDAQVVNKGDDPMAAFFNSVNK